jgi:hypothetical protein
MKLIPATSRIQQPHIIARRCVVENGRIVTKYLIDATKEMGRGNCYWLSSGGVNANGVSKDQI